MTTPGVLEDRRFHLVLEWKADYFLVLDSFPSVRMCSLSGILIFSSLHSILSFWCYFFLSPHSFAFGIRNFFPERAFTFHFVS